jgi:hypothetical protein
MLPSSPVCPLKKCFRFFSPLKNRVFFSLFVFGCNFCCMDSKLLLVIIPKKDLLSIDEKFVENL